MGRGTVPAPPPAPIHILHARGSLVRAAGGRRSRLAAAAPRARRRRRAQTAMGNAPPSLSALGHARRPIGRCIRAVAGLPQVATARPLAGRETPSSSPTYEREKHTLGTRVAAALASQPPTAVPCPTRLHCRTQLKASISQLQRSAGEWRPVCAGPLVGALFSPPLIRW